MLTSSTLIMVAFLSQRIPQAQTGGVTMWLKKIKKSDKGSLYSTMEEGIAIRFHFFAWAPKTQN